MIYYAGVVRGRVSFTTAGVAGGANGSFVILDEAQNATFTQIKMFLTRLGNNSTMVINGDPSQVDLAKSKESGLYETTKILKDIKEIK